MLTTTHKFDSADIEIRDGRDGCDDRLVARIEYEPSQGPDKRSLWWVKFVCVNAMDRGFRSIKAAEYYVLAMHIEDGTEGLESAIYLPARSEAN